MRPKIAGFSMVELMVGVTIFLIIIVASLYAFVSCTLLNESSNNLAIAANDAQSVLEEIKTLAFSGISSYAPGNFTNLTSEAITLDKAIGSNLATVTVNVSWQERQNLKNFSLSTCFAK